MAKAEHDPDEGREQEDTAPPSPPSHLNRKHSNGSGEQHPENLYCEYSADTDMEPAWRAAYALMHLKCETLLSVMLRPSFHTIQDTTMVPIYPCPHCGDGGLRTAGTVRLRKGIAFVRACDTCCAVEIGEQYVQG